MFNCPACKKTSEPREKPVMVVMATRPQVYTNEVVNPETEQVEIKVTHGSEIVKEFAVCKLCADGVPTRRSL